MFEEFYFSFLVSIREGNHDSIVCLSHTVKVYKHANMDFDTLIGDIEMDLWCRSACLRIFVETIGEEVDVEFLDDCRDTIMDGIEWHISELDLDGELMPEEEVFFCEI
jgi:hypothetical protein